MAAFSDAELTILAALAETFVRGDGEQRARLAADALEQVADPAQLDDLHLVLRAIDSRAVNLLLARRPTRFVAMDPDARERYLLGWAHSRIAQRRSAFGAFRKLLTFLAYADPGGRPTEPEPAGRRLPTRRSTGRPVPHHGPAVHPARDRRR